MYVVDVNHPNNKAIMHDTDCGKYTNRRRDRTHNGYWSETFESFEEAWNFAKRTGKKNIDTCAFCIRLKNELERCVGGDAEAENVTFENKI